LDEQKYIPKSREACGSVNECIEGVSQKTWATSEETVPARRLKLDCELKRHRHVLSSTLTLQAPEFGDGAAKPTFYCTVIAE